MSTGCGCQTGILKYIKPPYSNFFHEACCIHDYYYDVGGTKQSRKIADKILFDHCIDRISNLTDSVWKKVWLVHIALFYYISVRLFGRFYFNYE